MKTAVLLIGAVLAAMPQAVRAQVAPPSGQAPPPAPAAAQSCTGCHGPRGEGEPARGIPRIAGLPPYYSAKQFESYANGTRQNPAMEAIASSMSPRDLAIVTAYFAKMDAPVVRGPRPAAPSGAAERGRLLATGGSHELRVQACNNCHGPAGTGEPPAIPPLAGQSASYLVATLNAWREGTRRNDAGRQMEVIAKALTPGDIVAVAHHYSSLAAPPPPPLDVVLSPSAPPQPVVEGAEAVDTREAGVDSPIVDIGRLPETDLSAAEPARGQAILASGVHGCAACHTIPGVRGANGVVGPPLGGMAQRGFIAGQLPNRPDVLVAFLLDPPALVPSTGMPDTGLTREQALHIAAYLSTLER